MPMPDGLLPVDNLAQIKSNLNAQGGGNTSAAAAQPKKMSMPKPPSGAIFGNSGSAGLSKLK